METVFLFYFYLVAAGVIFEVLRVMWVALLCSIGVASLLSWGKIFSQLRRWLVIAVVVSAGFVIADVVYPSESTKPSEIVRDGTYSNFPCEKGQAVSSVDHKPCKPQPEPTKVARSVPVIEVENVQPSRKARNNSVPVSPAPPQPQRQPSQALSTAKEASIGERAPRAANIAPFAGITGSQDSSNQQVQNHPAETSASRSVEPDLSHLTFDEPQSIQSVCCFPIRGVQRFDFRRANRILIRAVGLTFAWAMAQQDRFA